MNGRMARLAERRERLIAQAEAQRRALAQDMAPWRTALALADQGLNAMRFLRRHPVWLLGAVALIVALRPAKAGKWLRRGWIAWRVVQKLGGGR